MTAGVACMDKAIGSLRALGMSPKFANPKNAGGACRAAKNHPVTAVRNMLNNLIKGKNNRVIHVVPKSRSGENRPGFFMRRRCGLRVGIRSDSVQVRNDTCRRKAG